MQLPEFDESKPRQEQGLYRKYDVRRTDGQDAPGCKHHCCDLFVLDVTHDPFAGAALEAYAKACKATHPELANDLHFMVLSHRLRFDPSFFSGNDE